MWRACGSVALLAAALSLPRCVGAQEPIPAAAAPSTLLDMPFVPQSEVLCGGAALAMVLRHHGVRGVSAEDFSHLVVDTGIGIRTTDLTAAATARGLEATPFTAREDLVRGLLAAGDPVIALIEDRPGVYHYVVLLAWGNGRVLFHDPAVGPHQIMDEGELLRAWQSAGYWALRTRRAPPMAPASGRAAPGGGRAAAADRQDAPRVAPTDGLAADAPGASRADRDPPSGTGQTACDRHLRDAADAAAEDDLEAAEQALELAGVACTDTTIVVRERAGLRFRQQRYEEAAADAESRLEHAPDDAYAWELLAATRFVQGQGAQALAAWNRIRRPYNDLTRIDGLRRTPYPVVGNAVRIEPGALVTPHALAHARRRIAALPAIARVRVDYRPLARDTVRVEVAVLERARLPLGAFDLAEHAARGAAQQRVLIRPANLLRLGEQWRIDGTWQENRRALGLGVSVPGVFGTQAIWHLDASVRDWSFDAARAGVEEPERETSRSVTLGISDWASPALSWRARIGLEESTHEGGRGSALAGGAVHLLDDRIVAGGDLSAWWAPAADVAARVRVNAALHTSRAARTQGLLLLHAALTGAAGSRVHWSGAGTAYPGAALLRAHPLLSRNGVIRSAWWAPRLAGLTLELQQWFTTVGPVDIGAAAFLDAAVAGGGAAPASGSGTVRTAVDGGAGIRLRLDGGPTVRLDAAHGIGNGARALSISLDHDLR